MEPNHSHYVYSYNGNKSFTLTKWKIRVGSQLLYNSVILSYKFNDHSRVDGKDPLLKYRSNISGTVVELLASEGDTVLPGTQLLKVQPCTHPIIMKDLCAECGTDLRHLDRDNFEKLAAATTFSMVHVVPELKVCLEQAEKLGRDDEDRLLKNKKLVLLVDLDQTLIHTTNDNVPKDLPDVHHFQLYGRNSPWYHTKLRPGTQSFLENISKYYELHICTFGARLYAHKIAQILDPGGKFFSHRILSRDECFDATSKTANLKALFPRGDNMVCIIDDREDVWNFAPNVVHVKPFSYFHNTGDINAPPLFMVGSNEGEGSTSSVINDSNVNEGEGIKECFETEISESIKNINDYEQNVSINTKSDNPQGNCKDNHLTDSFKKSSSEFKNTKSQSQVHSDDVLSKKELMESKLHNEFPPADDYLLYLEDILCNIHKEYYKVYDKIKSEGGKNIPDLKIVVPEVRRKVLKGCNIVFSSVIPVNLHPETSHFWTLAESLGASVSIDLVLDSSENRTTHVVASKLGTAKVNAAKRHEGIFIVNLDWLFCCAERWEHADEKLFPLEKDIVPPFLDGNKSIESNVENSISDTKIEKPLKKWPGAKRSHNSSKKKNGKLKNTEEIFSERVFVEAGLSLSQDDIDDMDKEIEEACSEESDKESQINSSSDSSSDESLSSADYPKGWKRPRKDVNDIDINDAAGESSDAETIGSVDEEIAEAVKQEFGP